MSGFITLNDGRTWTASNSAFDAVISMIAASIRKRERGKELADWLLTQRSEILGPGMGSLDLRELTTLNQEYVLQAIEEVCGSNPLADELTHWPNWMLLLGAMVRSYRAGEPPEALNPQMRGILPPTGLRSGPGWENANDSG